MNLLVVPEGRLGHDLSAAGVGAKFHKGFVDAIAEIWEPLRDDVEARMKKADRPLWITGHSLVGAIGSQAVKGLLAGSLIDEVWKYVNEKVSAHFLDSYDGLLKK